MTTTSETPSVDEAEAALARARTADEARRREAAAAESRRQSEEHGRATACVCCETPGQRLAYIGVTNAERLQGYKDGIVAYLCPSDRHAVAAEWQRRASAEVVNGRTRADLAAEYLDAYRVEAMPSRTRGAPKRA